MKSNLNFKIKGKTICYYPINPKILIIEAHLIIITIIRIFSILKPIKDIVEEEGGEMGIKKIK